MNIILIILFCFLFAGITWYRFHYGLFLFFLLLPTYLIRFHIGALPTTLLEIMFFLLLGVFILKEVRSQKSEVRKTIAYCLLLITKKKLLATGISLFLLGATISVFTSVNIRAAAGEWKAFYVEPVLLFFVLLLYNSETMQQPARHSPETKPIIGGRSDRTISSFSISQFLNFPFLISIVLLPLLICGLVTALLAIYQNFTGWMVPYAFWENRNTFRVTAWYGFPNAVGLFLAPLVVLAIYEVKRRWNMLKEEKTRQLDNSIISTKRFIKLSNYQITQLTNYLIFILSLFFIPCSLLAIFFAKSTGALIGVAAGIGLLLLFNKKTRLPAILIGLVGLVSLVSLPSTNSIKQELLLQDRSGEIRLAIWKETAQLLKDHPIRGAGLASYDERIAPYHTKVNGETIEIFHHPHNIFLTIWVNTGVLGLVGFILILVAFFKQGVSQIMEHGTWNKSNVTMKPYNNVTINFTPFLLSAMTVLLVSGLVDSPYIKNDLAMLFWALVACMVLSHAHHTTRQVSV